MKLIETIEACEKLVLEEIAEIEYYKDFTSPLIAQPVTQTLAELRKHLFNLGVIKRQVGEQQ